MPEYCYRCHRCGYTKTIIRSMRNVTDTIKCDYCDVSYKTMGRDFKAENKNVGDKDYGRPIHSDALAISPTQVEEHKRRFPDIKIDNEGRPIFDNYKKHQKYMDDIGVRKERQKRKRRGRKIETRTKKRPA